jgi:hypothetical protein
VVVVMVRGVGEGRGGDMGGRKSEAGDKGQDKRQQIGAKDKTVVRG